MILNDIGIEFGIAKCSTVCIKKGKICDMEDIDMPNGQRAKPIEEKGNKYLGIVQNSEIKTQVIKDKIRT